MHNTQVSIEITLKHSAVHFNHISKTIEIFMKLHLSGSKKHTKVQVIACNINVN